MSQRPYGAALDAAAAIFGVGVGLTVDEFALWLQLEDVYWTSEGRKSVDAIFCVLVITGALLGGTSFVTGRVGTMAWWWSVFVLAVELLLCVICVLKGKIPTGVVGVVIGFAALVGAIRLAKPGSWWAAHRYDSRPRRAARAADRYDERYEVVRNRRPGQAHADPQSSSGTVTSMNLWNQDRQSLLCTMSLPGTLESGAGSHRRSLGGTARLTASATDANVPRQASRLPQPR